MGSDEVLTLDQELRDYLEIEGTLVQHADVADCAIVAVPHRDTGHRIVAIVVVQPGNSVTAQKLLAFAASALPDSKAPTRIVFVSGPLARNQEGALLRATLQASLPAD
jgi:acyl-CoA synthetase (AMP-forming)/AMP-acid ligase II